MIIKKLAIDVLRACEPTDKVAAAHSLAREWRAGFLDNSSFFKVQVPDTPGRPEKPELVSPGMSSAGGLAPPLVAPPCFTPSPISSLTPSI